MKHSFCEDWEFTRHWTEAFGKGLPVPKQQAVRLPHTCREVPLHYATPADYEMVCGYRKRFRVPPVQAAPRLFVRFDGAAHQAVVRVNGRVAGQHRGGYTGFTVEITDLVDREGENLLTVQLDTREDPTIPPFGFVIDYLTYGGLYREVWLEATAESRLTDLFVYTPTLQEAVVQWTAELTPAAAAVRIRLETTEGTLLAEQTATCGRNREDAAFCAGCTAVGYRTSGFASCHCRAFERSRTAHRPQTGDVWLPHRRVPGGWLLPQRQKDLSAGAEPTPELP